MTQLKTQPKEMRILTEKLNKGEITWNDIPQELEKMRSQNAKQANKGNIYVSRNIDKPIKK